MAALGASEEVAFELMSKHGAKATVRDYSGRLPVSYLPDTDAGRRMKSNLQSQYAKMLEGSPFLSKLMAEAQLMPLAVSAKPTSLGSPLSPVSPTPVTDGKPSGKELKYSPTKRGKKLTCAPIRRKSTVRESADASYTPHTKHNDNQMISRDDLPSTTPTRISDFPALSRRRSITKQSSDASNYCDMVYSTITRRKMERGKNYNPTDPENQQTSFGRTPSLRSPVSDDGREGPEPTNEMPPISPRIPRGQNKASFVPTALPNSTN
ncbi:hypothetical protein Aperf_G00000006764 [Anoplocephala perfoliata]